MYNGTSIYVTDRPFVNVVHYQYVALFLISLCESLCGASLCEALLDLHSAYLS